AGIHPDQRTILAEEASFELERNAFDHQAFIGSLIFRDIIRMHKLPDRFADQIRFGIPEHITKSLVDEKQSSLRILTNNSGGSLPEDGAESLFGVSQRFFRLLALGDIEGCATNQYCAAIRSR